MPLFAGSIVECPYCGHKYREDFLDPSIHIDECDRSSVAREKFKKGDAVTFSRFGKEFLNLDEKKYIRRGEVVGFSNRDDELVRVKWNSLKTPSTYHMDFIRKVSSAKIPMVF